jgi:hypothetical protein
MSAGILRGQAALLLLAVFHVLKGLSVTTVYGEIPS